MTSPVPKVFSRLERGVIKSDRSLVSISPAFDKNRARSKLIRRNWPRCEGGELDTAYSFPAELTAPVELRGKTPRTVLLTGSGVLVGIAAAILLALSAAGVVWAGGAAARQRQHNSALRKNGRETEGAITQLHVSNSLESEVSYTFSAGDATYTGAARVPAELARSLRGFKSLAVLYLPANPAINEPAAWEPLPHLRLALLVVPMIAAVLGLMLFILLGIEYRMAAGGKPALAMISQCTEGRHGYLIHYRIRLGEETWIKGRGWCKSPQEPGNGIWVLYAPGRQQRSMPYPLAYCRVIK